MTGMQNTSYAEEAEISVLDILVILAESWKLLVFGPLLAGLLAGALSFLWPQTFESVAILRISEEEAALIHSAPVLDPLIVKFDLLQHSGGVQEDAREALKKRLAVNTDKKTKLTTLTVKAASSEAAQTLAKDAISHLFAEQVPKGKEKEMIEKTIAINSQAINVGEDGIEAIQRSLKRDRLIDLAQESAIKNLVVINNDVASRNLENARLTHKLQPHGAEVYVQEPILSQRSSAPKRTQTMILVAFAFGFSLIFFVFIRQAWRAATQDPSALAKVKLIKEAFSKK